MAQEPRKIVLGLGNLLFSDEGFGIHAVQRMQKQLGARYPVDWVDGGVLGLNLLPVVEACSHLLLLDAVNMGQPAGTLVELEGEQIPLYSGARLSEHQVGFQEVLALARLRGYSPTHLHLVGAQPGNLAPGIRLSDEIEVVMVEAMQRVIAILEGWSAEHG